MKLLTFSVFILSKCNRSHIISCINNPFFRYKKCPFQATLSPFFFSSYRCFSVTNPYKSNSRLSSQYKNGKLFPEVENEYAHQVMEKLSSYSSSLLKCPQQNKSCVVKTENLPKQLNAIERFVQITLQNISEGATLDNAKFTDIIRKLCIALPEASDESIKKVLHYLCMWPPTSSSTAQNFQSLWKLLDQECVKRMKQWDENFHRKFTKMSEKNNHLVFVYGTLKKGEPNHDLIEKQTEGIATFLGNAKTLKKWPLVIASRYNIPYLLYSEGRGMHVVGEIYEVDDIMLARLDELENHPAYYTRLMTEEVHMISDKESKLLKPWIYFLKKFRSELLELPCLSEYSSKGSHGLEYVSRYNRPSGQYYSDVMNP